MKKKNKEVMERQRLGIRDWGLEKTKKEEYMERIFSKDLVFSKAFLAAAILVAAAFSMVVIMYGVDTIIPKAHDTFHDVRHVLGMPCH